MMDWVTPPNRQSVLNLRSVMLLMTTGIILLVTVVPPPMFAELAPSLQRFLMEPAVAYAQSPTLELTKRTATTTIESGTPFEYILTYKCASITDDCDDVTIVDTLPVDLEYVPGSALPTSHIQSIAHNAGTITWTFINPLPAGSTGVLRFSAQFKPGTLPGTTAKNEATIDASNALSITAQSTVVVSDGAFEMIADKTGPDDVVIGFPADFAVGICSPDSSGGIRLTNPVITDTLPADALFVDAEGVQGVDWTYTPAVAPDQGGTVVFTNLPPVVEVGGCLTRRVTLQYDSDLGSVQTNAMAASGVPEGTSTPVLLTDTHGFGVIAPYPGGQFGKSSTSLSKFTGAAAKSVTEALAGEAVTYTVSLANTGYVTLTNVVITDALPTELDLQAWQVSATITKPVSGFYQVNSDGNWLPLIGNPYTTTTTIPVAALGLLTDTVTHLRWDLSPMDVLPTRTPAYRAWIAGTANATLSLGDTFDNCGYARTNELTNTLSACNTVEIIAQRALPRMAKSNGSGPFLPLSTVDFTLEVSNDEVAHLDFADPVLADLLAPELTFLTGTVTFDNSGAPGAPAPNFVAIDDYNGSGRTLLRWAWTDQSGSGGSDARYSLAPGERLVVTFQAQVVDGTPPGAYPNEAVLLDWSAPGDPDNPAVDPEKLLLCAEDAGLVYTDTLDLDGDSRTDEISCLAGSTVTVPVALSMNSEKFVRGTLDCQNTTDYGATTACEDDDYNKLGLTVLGGDVDYRLIMTNTSNVSVTKITLIDIFPHIGDTGVIDPQARQSVWGPNLQAPVTAPGGIPLTIYYSTATNPCRTELVPSGPSGCSPPN